MKIAAILCLGLGIPALLIAGSIRGGAAPAEPAVIQAPRQQAPPPMKPPGQDSPKGQTQISVSVDLVNLQALVTDKKDNIITGLKAGNFTLYEDNVKQEITNFTPVEAGMTVVMLVEFSKMVQWFIEDVWNAIFGFADSLRRGDWVAVIGYDMRPTILTDFTQNRAELMDALMRFNTPAFSESNLCDALIFTLDRVEEIEGKVAVLLVSTGMDTFSKHLYDEALAKCKSSNASIYAIGIGQSVRLRYNLDDISLLMADNRLRSVAEFTGGEAFFPRFTSEFPSIFKNISAMLRNQYSLAYVSTNTKKDGKFRKVRLEARADLNGDGKLDDLKVKTRSGYIAREK